MSITKTHVATAWYLETGTRFKGRIDAYQQVVRTPYGIYKYEYRMTPHGLRPYFPELCALEGPSCPLLPEVVEVLHEDKNGDLQWYGEAILPAIPRGYKSIVRLGPDEALATRANGVEVVMGGLHEV